MKVLGDKIRELFNYSSWTVNWVHCLTWLKWIVIFIWINKFKSKKNFRENIYKIILKKLTKIIEQKS